MIVRDDGKVAAQCAAAAVKGYQILGLVARTFVSRDKRILMPLYKTLVRPHLDFCVQAWRPHLVKDVEVLERVQRRATRLMCGGEGRDYEERLKVLSLTTLETRRIRADMIEVFKIIKGEERIDERIFFRREEEGRKGTLQTRGNVYKLFKKRVRLDVAKYSFGNRVIDWWNQLPDSVVKTEDLGAFKGRLDKFLAQSRGLI